MATTNDDGVMIFLDEKHGDDANDGLSPESALLTREAVAQRARSRQSDEVWWLEFAGGADTQTGTWTNDKPTICQELADLREENADLLRRQGEIRKGLSALHDQMVRFGRVLEALKEQIKALEPPEYYTSTATTDALLVDDKNAAEMLGRLERGG